MSLVQVNDQLANIAQIVRRCPTVTLRRAFVSAYRTFCDATKFVTVNATGATEAGTAQYALGSDPYLEIIGLRAVQLSQTVGGRAQAWPAVPSDPSTWDPNMPDGRPTLYAYVPHGQFVLHATPDAVYDVSYTAIVQPKTENVSWVPSEGLSQFSNAIEAGALAYLLRIPGEPWTDPNMAERHDRDFRVGISNAKAQAQRNHNMGSQRLRPRPFFVR